MRLRTKVSPRIFLRNGGCSRNEIVLVLALVLEWKRWNGLRRLHIGLVGIVTGSVSGATPYQIFEHEHEHERMLNYSGRNFGDKAQSARRPG